MMKLITVEKAGTEALSPTVYLKSPEKKRDLRRSKKNTGKRKFNAGEDFVDKKKKGKAKGKIEIIKQRKMKEGCNASCTMKCSEDLNARMELFDAYWALPSMTEKWSYVTSRITQNKVQRKRKRKLDSEKERSITYEYWFPAPSGGIKDGGYNIRVCQKMFLDTLDISTTAVRTAFEKYHKQTGTQEPDKRGCHDNKKRIDKIQEQGVIEHISSFKVVESHYVRKNEKCQFLPKDLTISEMHRLFLRFYEEESYEKVNFNSYKRVFRRKFPLKFQKPKKDECNTCASYKGLETKTAEQEEAQGQHMRDKEYTRSLQDELKSLAKKEEHVVTAAFY